MAQEKIAFPSDAAEKFVVRFPDGMRDQIAESAKKNGRTMNAEIVARLQASFEPTSSLDAVAAQMLADSRAQTIRQMEFLQGSLCETVAAMYVNLPAKDQRDRTFANAQRLASSLLVGARPGDYLLQRTELLAANPALARFLDEVEVDIAEHNKKDGRVRVPGASKR